MRVPYNQVNAILVNSYKPIYPSYVLDADFTVSLSDYIKSQVHFNIVSDLFNRDLSLYTKSLKYIEGDLRYSSEFAQVVRYYYSDMFSALLKNYVQYGKEVGISILCDINSPNLLPFERISIGDILEELNTKSYRILRADTLSKFDSALLETGRNSVTFAKALLLYEFSTRKETSFLEMR